MPTEHFTLEDARQLWSYDPETGLITWRERRSTRVGAGQVAGHADERGRIRIVHARRSVRAHRLAWLLTYGEWPTKGIDHINGDPGDNRIANLRLADQSLNMQNQRRARLDNKVGLLGVSKVKRNRLYNASIRIAGRTKNLGYFQSPQAAHEAYLAAKRVLHPGCTI